MSKPKRNTTETSRKDLGKLQQHQRVFSMLGRHLGAATTVKGTAEVILAAADELMGWDCAALNLYSSELDTVSCVIAMDVLEGRRVELPDGERDVPPTAKMRQVIGEGAQLVLRESLSPTAPEGDPFGDKSRSSASLMFVPVRYQKRVTGVLTIQNYTPKAYTEEDLEVLQALADHCGGAIERIQVEGLLRRTEELYRRAIGGVGAVPYIYDYRTHSYSFIGEGIEALTGYTPKEISAEVWARIIKESAMAGEAAGLEKQEAARRVQTGELRNWRCDMRVVTREGQTRWLSDASVQNLDESGRAIGSMGILEDITERKQSELSALALSQLSQRLILATTLREVAQILSDVGDKLFGWDSYGFYLYVPESDKVQPVYYVDTLKGQRTDVTPAKSQPPSALERRELQEGAELTLQEGTALLRKPGAAPVEEASRPSASIMRVPVRLRTNKVSGIVSFHSHTPHAYTKKDLGTLQTLADCCGVALERIWADEAVEKMHRQLLDVSRQAGMAEVATSVLHNVGNVLNSVNISSSLIAGKVKTSKITNVAKAVALMQEHAADLANFLTQDPKGKQLLGYLNGLAEHLAGEQREILDELKSLGSNIEHINEIVAMQQSYAKVLGVLESLPVVELVEDALRLNAGALDRHHVHVTREFAPVPPVLMDKHKVLQILINLIRNAKYALDDGGGEDRRMTVRIAGTENQTVKISVSDNGVGIPAKNLTRIFEHGFTTRKEGHGFGLHNGALAAKEFGGSLTAHSDGPGKGATFILELPLQAKG